MASLKRNEDTDVECHLCHGNGIDKKGYVGLLSLCHKCNGYGWVDWVAGAVKGSIKNRYRPNEEMQFRIAQQNLHILRNKIIDIGMEVGYRVTVDIKTFNINEEIMSNRPKIIKTGDY